jgi:hypothetical protein
VVLTSWRGHTFDPVVAPRPAAVALPNIPVVEAAP